MPVQNEWEAEPGKELTIPREYVEGLRFEIVVLTHKKTITFRCQSYAPKGYTPEKDAWVFGGVIIDTSKLNARGEVTLQRLTYHETIELVNAAFMVVPAPEVSETPADS